MRFFRSAIVTAATAALLAVLPTTVVQAQESGLSNMHAQAPVGNRICMTDHSHDGKGTGTTEAEARMAAARNWSGFTEWEYGAAWGSYALANGKRERCEPEFGQVACYFVAYPCKGRGGRSVAAVAPRKPAAGVRAAGPRPVYRKSGTVKSKALMGKPVAPRAAKRTQKRQYGNRPAPKLQKSVWTSEQMSGAFAQLR